MIKKSKKFLFILLEKISQGLKGSKYASFGEDESLSPDKPKTLRGLIPYPIKEFFNRIRMSFLIGFVIFILLIFSSYFYNSYFKCMRVGEFGEIFSLGNISAYRVIVSLDNRMIARRIRDGQEAVIDLGHPELINLVMQTLQETIFLIDEEGIIRDCCGSVEAILGYEREELIGKPITVLIPSVDLHKMNDRGFERVTDRRESEIIGKGAVESLIALRKDGAKIPVSMSSSIKRAGDVTYFVASVKDVAREVFSESLERALVAITDTLNLNFKEMLNLILEEVFLIVPADVCNIMLIENDHVFVVAYHGYGEMFGEHVEEYIKSLTLPLRHFAIFTTMLGNKEPVLVPDTTIDVTWVLLDEMRTRLLRTRTYIGIPIIVDGEVIGFLNVEGKKVAQFDSSHVEALKTYSKFIACAIKNFQTHKARPNSVTGLPDREYLWMALEILSSIREVTSMAVVYIDVDGLKFINNINGHDAGDKMLKAVADVLKKSVREGDIIAQFGGDEIVVVLPNCSEELLFRVLERVEEKIETYNSEMKNQLPMSLSIGYATLMRGEEEHFDNGDVEVLIDKAEVEMRQKKRENRENCRERMLRKINEILDRVNPDIVEHMRRLEKLMESVAQELGFSERNIGRLKLLARYHDIGMIAMPEGIFEVESPLDEEKIKMVRTHSEISYRITKEIQRLESISWMIFYQHKWYNGEGYPDVEGVKIAGENIPVESRLLAILDAYDAMVSGYYKDSLSHDEAILELREGAGTQFDPVLVGKIIPVLDQIHGEIYEEIP